MYLSFDVAHVFNGSEADEFEAIISTDCGATWTPVVHLAGSTGANSFSTGPINSTSVFSPNAASQWKHILVDVSTYKNNTGLLVGFRGIAGPSGTSQSCYVDNINLRSSSTVVLGIENKMEDMSKFSIYPNPTNDFANLHFDLNNSASISYTVTDIVGNQISNVNLGNLSNGVHNINIDTKDFTSGIYIVSIKTNGE